MYWEKDFNLAASTPAHRELAGFLLENASGLVSAARLLGGCEAVRRVGETIEGVSTSTVLSRRHHRDLAALHRLLSLERVDVADSIEAACFATIDPSWPVVEEICLLTDQLAAHLDAIAAENDHEPAPEAA